jgi:hypothetical protein
MSHEVAFFSVTNLIGGGISLVIGVDGVSAVCSDAAVYGKGRIPEPLAEVA